jgi:hypothetical protein
MRVSLHHYAFSAPARWLDAAEEALTRFARDDDPASLTDLLRDWDAEVDRERTAARITPTAEVWGMREAALRAAGGPSPGARREVFRDPWERLDRSLRRMGRFEELEGPQLFIDNEREMMADSVAALDSKREPVALTYSLDRIPSTDGGPDIVDLGQFGWHLAELAAGAFPRSLGLGDRIESCLPALLVERLQEFAQLDDYWLIHGQRLWEPEVHASWIVSDTALWAPPELKGRRALALADVGSPSCRAWRELLPWVPVGERGGPLCVEPSRGGGCLVSFMLVRTPDSPAFVCDDDDA